MLRKVLILTKPGQLYPICLNIEFLMFTAWRSFRECLLGTRKDISAYSVIKPRGRVWGRVWGRVRGRVRSRVRYGLTVWTWTRVRKY